MIQKNKEHWIKLMVVSGMEEFPEKISMNLNSAYHHITRNMIGYHAAPTLNKSMSNIKRYFKCVSQEPMYAEYQVSYNDPYGVYTVFRNEHHEPIVNHVKKLPSKAKNQTYCTMLVSTVLREYMNEWKLTYSQAKKQKHPIRYFCKETANEVCQRLAAGKMLHKDYEFKPTDKATATDYAQSGGLVIVAWENKKINPNTGKPYAGHVSTLIGDNLCYNAGASYGVMSIKRAFGRDDDSIKYYLLLKGDL